MVCSITLGPAKRLKPSALPRSHLPASQMMPPLAGGGVGNNRDIGNVRLLQPAIAALTLAICISENMPSCMPRAAEAETIITGRRSGNRRFDQTRQLLTHYRAHAPAEKIEFKNRQRHGDIIASAPSR